MKDDAIMAPATLFVGNLVDGGQSWRMVTQDIPMDLKKQATELHGVFGWAVFSPNPITDKDIPKGAAKDKKLTPSQRLRYVLIARARHMGIDDDNQEKWYHQEMQRIINQEKGKL